MDTLVKERLGRYRKQVEESAILDRKFGELVGIDFFDFIKQEPPLWQEFDRRVKYLNNLATDKQFIKIQDQLRLCIYAVLNVIGPTRVKEAQKWFTGNALYLFPKKAEEGFKTLPQIYEILLKSENYYRLGDDYPHFFPEKGDMLHSPLMISMIRKQYHDDFETLIKYVRGSMGMNEAKEPKYFKRKLESFYDIRDLCEEKLYAEPIKLHVAGFLSCFHFSMSARSHKDYRDHYNFLNSSLYEGQHRPYKVEEIKAACLQVIDDLSEVATHLNSRDTPKTKIFVDSTKGIYRDGGNPYDIASKRRDFVFKLLETEPLTSDDLQDFWKDSAQVTHAINDINKIFKKKLDVSENLVINSQTAGGYILNRENFEFVSQIAT